jgi:hypothetical protein
VGGRKPARPEPATGTRGWTEVKGSVTAPTTARRMALFLGARSCGGSVGYDEIRVLAARPGTGAVQVASSVGPAPDRPLVDPQTLRFVEVPLSGAFNRPLRDDMPDDGQGWLDLGPGYDLSGFPLGKKDYHGVPFSVADKCLMLKSPYRILSILPDRTNVPVNVRADVLYFLHTAAWVKPGERQWTYAVKYDDGTEREIPVIGGVNVREWGQAHSVVFDNPAGMRTVPAPEVTGNTLSPSCGMYIMEWVNPRPEAVIREIELVAAGRGVPVLFAITAGTKK